MEKSRKSHMRSIITLLLLVSLICLPIVAWGASSTSSGSTFDASIIVASEDAEEVVDEEEPIEDSDTEPAEEPADEEGSSNEDAEMEEVDN